MHEQFCINSNETETQYKIFLFHLAKGTVSKMLSEQQLQISIHNNLIFSYRLAHLRPENSPYFTALRFKMSMGQYQVFRFRLSLHHDCRCLYYDSSLKVK